MKMRRNSITALVVALALGFMLFIAFAVPRNKAPLSNRTPITQERLNIGGNTLKSIPPIATAGPKVTPKTAPKTTLSVDKAKADKIHKSLSKMKELSKAGVVVAGNTALVGYSPSKTAKNVSATKALIAREVKKSEPSIKNIIVSESADIMTRINKLTSDIANKKPAHEISNEFNKLIKGATPAVAH